MDARALEISAIAAGWVLYCFLHSLLIHPPVSDRIRGWLGRGAGAYRCLYNTFSLLALVPLAVAHVVWRGPWLVDWEGLWLAVPALLNAGALVFFILGAAAYGPSDFLGLAGLREALGGPPASGPGAFSTRGILRWVRHPWYTGTFLLLWGHDLDAAGLVASLVLTAYLFVGTRLEERKLVTQFGDAYRAYQGEVPMFIPRKPGKSGGEE